MCGRFALFADDDELVSLFDVDLLLGEHAPSFNVAPSQEVRVVMDRLVDEDGRVIRTQASGRTDPGATGSGTAAAAAMPVGAGTDPTDPARVERQLRLLRWGLVPSWAKTPERPIINARAETLTTKPSFRAAAARRRCLVPANGYFEWQSPASGPKQPWFLSAGQGDPVIALAGISEVWRVPDAPADEGDSWLLTCAIVTRSAPDALGEIHDRMPVVVPPDRWDAWLDPRTTDPASIDGLLRGLPDPALVPRKVSRAVGNVRNDSEGLIEPAP
jgi:Uncharacterized conserved protein